MNSWGIERHQLVSLGTFDEVVLPLEGDDAVVERDQTSIATGLRHFTFRSSLAPWSARAC